ncbi:hypothetical protein LJK87_01475 [Paenibacillus sp. P25]|nr:hypothetical protein LJK87_01475 [Paenibacillus sp. P25]
MFGQVGGSRVSRLVCRSAQGAVCIFSYSLNGGDYTVLAVEPFEASEARWVGAKMCMFASGSGGGYLDIDWFRVIHEAYEVRTCGTRKSISR